MRESFFSLRGFKSATKPYFGQFSFRPRCEAMLVAMATVTNGNHRQHHQQQQEPLIPRGSGVDTRSVITGVVELFICGALIFSH